MSIESIETIKTNTLTKLAEISASPRPSYSIDGQSVDHNTYRKQLMEMVDWCDKQLANEEPFEITSQGFC